MRTEYGKQIESILTQEIHNNIRKIARMHFNSEHGINIKLTMEGGKKPVLRLSYLLKDDEEDSDSCERESLGKNWW